MSSEPSSLVVFTAAHLGQLLVTSRKRCKFTQAHVASCMGLSQNRVSYLERHAGELSFKQLLVYCAVVGLQMRFEERPLADERGSISEW